MEEYKKLSELPQASTPNRCEAYGIEAGKSVRIPLTFATPDEINSAVANEKKRAMTAEESIAQSLQAEIRNRSEAMVQLKQSIELVIDGGRADTTYGGMEVIDCGRA